MAKKKASKKKEESYINKNKKYFIGIAIILLSIFAFFQTGVFGVFLANMVRYLVGNFIYAFLIYVVIITVFLMLSKGYYIFKTKIGNAYSLLNLSLFLYMGNKFFANKASVYTLSNQIKDITDPSYSDGTGILGWLITFSLVKFIGYVGVIILIVLIVVFSGYLLFDKNKIKSFFDFEEPEITPKKESKKTSKNVAKPQKEVIEEVVLDESIIKEKPESIKSKIFDFPSFKKETNKVEVDPLFGQEKFVPTDKPDATKFILEEDPLSHAMKLKREQEPIILDEELHVEEPDPAVRNIVFEPIVPPSQMAQTKPKESNEVTEPSTFEPKELSRDIDQEVADLPEIDIPIFMEEKADVRDVSTPRQVRLSKQEYKIPSVKLLKSYGDNSDKLISLKKSAKLKAETLKTTLASFGLNVEILNIHIGPNVTKYELQPEMGVKVSKFQSLSNDIAMSLAASGVRIEAPIPGKAAVGIEIANDETMMVSLQEVLLSTNNKDEKKLQIGLGKDISGNAIFTDIATTPHLLVAGSTGSGKSVCINSIIVSILTKASPDEVKMVMIDPKKVELTPYNGVPHLLSKVVTEPKKAAVALNKMVAEMEWRYELFAETNSRNIAGYNEKVSNDPESSYDKLPYIVIIVDELADLMMVASNEVETAIARLAQMARAAGIHLIIATQRPSTDVITGLIKANIPSRIAFAVSSSIDSRTILGYSGAEKLLGRGDMLYSEQGSNNLHRIQGAFLSDEEVELIVSEITSQFSSEEIEKQYDESLTVSDASISPTTELDDIYEEVYNEVVRTQKASASGIQRRFGVGYNRATRIMDQLEANDVISPNEGTKPRRVLIGDDLDESLDQ